MEVVSLGFFVGLVVGLLAALIAFFQMLPKWRKWGFARARTKIEREIIAPSQEEMVNNTSKYSRMGIIAVILIGVKILPSYLSKKTGWSGDDTSFFIMALCLAFILALLFGYLALTFLADYLIRKNGVK